MKQLKLIVVVVSLMTLASRLEADPIQISLAPADVVAYSGYYNSTFLPGNVLDTQTGPVNETQQPADPPTSSGYWIAADNASKQPDWIVINLGQQSGLYSFELYNTHNANYDDRGTGNFTITASNTLANLEGATPVGNQLASGFLNSASSSVNPIAGQSFISTDSGDTYQYIRFDALSVNASGIAINANAVGLNEIRVFAVPEPSSSMLFAAGAAALWAVARRRRKA